MEKSQRDLKNSKASITKKMICYGVFAVPVSIISLALLILMIFLGSKGISSGCDSNSTLLDFISQAADSFRGNSDLEMNVPFTESFERTLESGSNAYLQWLAGASGCGVLWSFVTLLALWLLVEFMVRYNYLEHLKKEKKKKDKKESKVEAGLEVDEKDQDQSSPEKNQDQSSAEKDQDQNLISKTANSQSFKDVVTGIGEYVNKDWSKLQTGADIPDKEDIKEVIDTVGKYVLTKLRSGGLQRLTPLSLVGLFFGLLFFMVALLSFLFALAMAAHHVCRVQITVSTFLIAGSLAVMITPMCLSMSVILLGTIVEFVTLGRIDFRQMIPNLIPAVKFKEGEKNDYWVLRSRFYFPMAKRNKHLENGYFYSFKFSWPTWFLTIIMLTSVHMALSYFLDNTLVTELTAIGCNDPRLDRRFDCFVPGTLDYVSCMEGEEVELLHCYRFHRFGEEDNLVMAGSTSFAFYLATVAVFGQIFSVVKILLQIKPTRLWGFGFLTFGGLAIAATFTLFGFWVSGYASETFSILSRLTIITQAQLLLVSIYLLMIGLLLTVSKWWEKVSKDNDAVARSLFEPTEKETEQLERDLDGEMEQTDSLKKEDSAVGTIN